MEAVDDRPMTEKERKMKQKQDKERQKREREDAKRRKKEEEKERKRLEKEKKALIEQEKKAAKQKSKLKVKGNPLINFCTPCWQQFIKKLFLVCILNQITKWDPKVSELFSLAL